MLDTIVKTKSTLIQAPHILVNQDSGPAETPRNIALLRLNMDQRPYIDDPIATRLFWGELRKMHIPLLVENLYGDMTVLPKRPPSGSPYLRNKPAISRTVDENRMWAHAQCNTDDDNTVLTRHELCDNVARVVTAWRPRTREIFIAWYTYLHVYIVTSCDRSYCDWRIGNHDLPVTSFIMGMGQDYFKRVFLGEIPFGALRKMSYFIAEFDLGSCLEAHNITPLD